MKDSVFTHLFRDKRYTLQLFQALHPEATGVTEESIRLVTLENVLVDNFCNDLSFLVGDQLLVLVEAQSSWTVNIIVRALLYYLYTLKEYIAEHRLYLYGGEAIDLPEPEFYVIYTGEKRLDKETITLSEEFFGGRETALDV